MKIIVEKIELRMDFAPKTDNISENVPLEVFDEANKMFLFLGFCPDAFVQTSLGRIIY